MKIEAIDHVNIRTPDVPGTSRFFEDVLAMTVESWLAAPVRPIVFVPVYIGYERLVEGDAYAAELVAEWEGAKP